MIDDDVAWYERVVEEDPDIGEPPSAWSVIQPLTMPVTVPEVVRRLGGDPAAVEERSGWDRLDEHSSLHLRAVGPAVVVFQAMGWEGVRDEALRWLSDGAVVHSSAWSGVNGRSTVCYAAFGRVLTRLDHIDDDEPTGDQPTALDEDRAPLRPYDGYGAQLALVERRTGIRLDLAWWEQPHPTVVIRTPIPDDPRPPGSLGATDPDLSVVFLLADEPTQRAAVGWVLDLLAGEHDLRGEAVVPAVIGALPERWPSGDALHRQAEELRFRLSREIEASPGGSPERWRRYHRMRAAEAVKAVVDGPVSRSPLDGLWSASLAFDQRWPAIRAELWHRLRR